MKKMSDYDTDTESYCCCSLRDRCLMFAAQVLVLFALADVGILASLVIINFSELERDSLAKFPDNRKSDINIFYILAFAICTGYIIVTVCCIAGISKKRRWMLLVFLIVFGIYVVLHLVSTLYTVILLVRQISTDSVITVVIFLAFSFFYIWGWCSVLKLFRKLGVPASQCEMAMSLLPSTKPVTDDVDIENDAGDIEDAPPQYTDHA